MAISHTKTNNVSKVTAYIKLAIRFLSQYIEQMVTKYPKETEYDENHTSYILKLIENAFINISKRDLQKIKAFFIDGTDDGLIDFLLEKKNREDILVTKESPNYLKARSAAFLMYELYKKLLKVTESKKEISYPFVFPELNEANFDKLIKWTEDTKKYFLYKGLISEPGEETNVSVINQAKEVRINQEERANKEFDSLWSDKTSAKNNVIRLLEDYMPYSWNILSRKHEVQTVKETIAELRKRLHATPIEVYLYLKAVETSHKGKVKTSGEFSRKLRYAIERLEHENLCEMVKEKYIHTASPSQLEVIFNRIKQEVSFEHLQSFWSGQASFANNKSFVCYRDGVKRSVTISSELYELIRVIYKDGEQGAFSEKKLQDLIAKAKELSSRRIMSFYTTPACTESTRKFLGLIAKINLHNEYDATVQIFLNEESLAQFYKVPGIRYEPTYTRMSHFGVGV